MRAKKTDAHSVIYLWKVLKSVPAAREMLLPPDDGHVRVVFDDLLERGQVDARHAADLVCAEPACEQAPQPRHGLAPAEPVRAPLRPDVHRVPRIVIGCFKTDHPSTQNRFNCERVCLNKQFVIIIIGL